MGWMLIGDFSFRAGGGGSDGPQADDDGRFRRQRRQRQAVIAKLGAAERQGASGQGLDRVGARL